MDGRYKRRPKHRWSDGEVIIKVAGARVLQRVNAPVGSHSAHREAQIPGPPVIIKIQLVLDQERTNVGIVAHAVATNPGVHQGQRQEEQHQKRPDTSP